ncbi:MAG: hypothetical protein M3Q42_08910 [Pseudomonadota bacterium]|nr:hypothetical protein [Pseudomonadota bacterium]
MKDRKGRQLNYDDLTHYQAVMADSHARWNCRLTSTPPSPMPAAGRYDRGDDAPFRPRLLHGEAQIHSPLPATGRMAPGRIRNG